jgi:hypothetical protein
MSDVVLNTMQKSKHQLNLNYQGFVETDRSARILAAEEVSKLKI